MEKTIYNMLVENTGTHMLDSGWVGGRKWEENQWKTLQDFRDEKEVEFKLYENWEYTYTINLFHFLNRGGLEIDEIAREFNEIESEDWNGEYYGVSEKQQEFLDAREFEKKSEFNSYNHNSNLSQVIQGTVVGNAYGDLYLLLQIHGGADVRWGYTDAKMFKIVEDSWIIESVDGEIDGARISNFYDGDTLRYDDDLEVEKNDEEIEPTKNSDVKLRLVGI